MENVALHSPPTADGAQPATGEPTGSDRLKVILVLGALIALGPLTIDMYLPALPAIGDDLQASPSTVQLSLTGTLLGLGLGQLLIGPFSDIVGRRIPLIAGTILHIASSMLCLMAPNIAVLGVLRTVQGVGAAATMVVAMAVVRDLFTGRAAATALSRLVLVMGVAPILAPSLGGAILLAGSWRGVFGALAALGAVLLVVALLALPETLPPQRRQAAQFRPMLRTYRTLITDRDFVLLTVVAALAMSALFSYVSGSSFVLQQQFGLNQQVFGVVFGIGAVALIGASQCNVVLLNRYTPRQIVFRALSAATVAGLVLTVLATTGTGGLLGFVIPLWLVLGAMGFVLPNAPALALSRHGEAAGTAAALVGAVQFGLGALIAPLVGLLGNDGPAMAITMTGGAAIALVALGVAARLGPVDEPTDAAA
ncbi:putative multidrug resistance transporter, Bcr/CflA family protein [Saccharopolyspora subtropica]|uniref:Multidrug effflux MFS transporter n=2 Tax=Saccharopolyspora thermophila TaxID=89367 RepID=A0A917JUV2_9PSEU|nr:putative multidrug resistance transporter, Bcr/CflA family protein [Saccharopolyspora subtropica]